MKRSVLAMVGLGVFGAGTSMAQDASQAASTPKAEDEVVKREEVIVVSASKVETTLINAPATLSVVSPETIASSPAQNFGDLLRSVPGMNIIQTSARDINITARQATSTLTNSQLTLLDGRSIYLDFFGLVLWDFIPQSPNEIKQIEVVRGPASAVWGANALTGVVNVITKSPREAAGTGFTLTSGLLNRDAGSRQEEGEGYSGGGNFFVARAPNDRWSWKLSAGYYYSDPFSRPTGTVPRVPHPLNPAVILGGAPYPADGSGTGSFENTSTSQPKADVRVDQELASGARLTYQGGYAGTEGIIHTGIGPFDIESGSYLAYGKVNYSKNALKVNFFGNFTDAKAPNLLNVDPATLEAVRLNFKTQTYDLEFGNSNVVAGKHIFSYGGNYRRNNFDITLTPASKDRNEFGGYFQEEFFTDKLRLALGLRVDKFGNIEGAVFSPRITAMVKPTTNHSIRVSFNRAFRSPSVVNNYLDQDVFSPTTIDLRPLAPFAPPALAPALSAPFNLRVKNVGSEVVVPGYELKEESLNAYEFAYTGHIGGKTTVGFAVYQNDSDNNINFTQLLPSAEFPTGGPGFDVWTLANAPQVIGINANGVAVPGPALLGFLQAVRPLLPPVLQAGLPRTVSTYLNLGPLRQRGVELSLEHSVTNEWSFFGNYSYQAEPDVLDPDPGQIRYPAQEVAIPSEHRVNAGINWNTRRLVGTLSVNYASEALWTDVLGNEYSGFTDAYAMVNASFGVKLADGRLTASLKGTNLFNETIQQHVFGDLIKRAVFAELRFFLR